MTIKEAAQVIGVSSFCVWLLARNGFIQAEKNYVPRRKQRWELLDSDVEAMAAKYKADKHWRRRQKRVTGGADLLGRWVQFKSSGGKLCQLADDMGISFHALRKRLERAKA